MAQDVRGKPRRHDRRGQLQHFDRYRESAGRFPKEDRQRVFLVGALAPKVDFLRGGGVEGDLRLNDVGPADQAGVKLLFRQAKLLLVGLDGLEQDVVLRVQKADGEVIRGDVRLERLEHDLVIVDRSAGLGEGDFGASFHAAPDVDFIA